MTVGRRADTTWTEADDIVDQWRPLKPAEIERAEGLIGLIERFIRRTWRDTQERTDAGDLGIDDVKDVVVWSVIPLIAPGTRLPPNVRSWQETSGSESQSVTLDAGQTMEFAGWMVDVFEGKGRGADSNRGPSPAFGFPSGGGHEHLFPFWPENGGRRGSA